MRGWALATSRGDAEGVAEIQRAVASLAQSGTGVGGPQILGSLGEACWKVGRPDDALRALEVGVARAQEHGQHYYDAELLRLRAEVMLDANGDAGGIDEARALLHQALEISQGQQARSFELRVAVSLARLQQRQGERAEARALLEPVYAWFTEGFDTQDLKDAKALLDELA